MVQLRKLLFSATLTHNPAKLAALQLHYPLYFRFSATLKYNTPTTLTVRESRQRASERERELILLVQEHMVLCNAEEKPVVLKYLLDLHSFRQVLCFTSSVESTHRYAVEMIIASGDCWLTLALVKIVPAAPTDWSRGCGRVFELSLASQALRDRGTLSSW